jgi:DNA-binding NarL/FixJ family response regulator
MRPESTSTSKIRLGLADPQPIVLAGVRALVQLAHDIEIVGEANDGRQALQLVRSVSPDVVVIEPSIPELGGAELVSALKKDCLSVRILVLTSDEDHALARLLLRAGANGIATKASPTAEILRAIRVVAAGDMHIDPTIARRLLGGEDASIAAALSEREEEILRLVARGFGSKEAATKLGLSIKTVQTYRARAIKKLQLRTRAEIVRYGIHRRWLE